MSKYPQLDKYVAEEIKKGKTTYDLEKEMIQNGYTQADANEVLEPLKKQQAMINNNPARNLNQNQVSNQVPNQSPNHIAPSQNINNPGGNFRKTAITVLITLLVLAGIAGASYFAYQKFVVPSVSIGEAVVNTTTAFSAGEIKSGSIALSFKSEVTDANKFQSAFDFDSYADQSSLNGSSAEIDLNLDYVDSDDRKNQSVTKIDFMLDPGDDPDFAMFGKQELSFETRSVNEKIYFYLENIPSALAFFSSMMGIDIAELSNTWLYIPMDFAESQVKTQVNAGFGSEIEEIPDVETLDEDLKILIKGILDDSGAVETTAVKNDEKIGNVSVKAHVVNIDLVKASTYYINNNPDWTTSEKEMRLEEMQNDSNLLKMNEILKKLTVEMYVGNDGYFYGYSITNNELEDVGLNFELSLKLKDFNSEILIVEPEEAENFESFIENIMNVSINEESQSNMTYEQSQDEDMDIYQQAQLVLSVGCQENGVTRQQCECIYNSFEENYSDNFEEVATNLATKGVFPEGWEEAAASCR